MRRWLPASPQARELRRERLPERIHPAQPERDSVRIGGHWGAAIGLCLSGCFALDATAPQPRTRKLSADLRRSGAYPANDSQLPSECRARPAPYDRLRPVVRIVGFVGFLHAHL